MGLRSSTLAHQYDDPSILSEFEWEYLTKRKYKQKDPELTISIARLLLLHGYFRCNGCHSISMDLIFVCYDFYVLSQSDSFCFQHFINAENGDNNDTSVMKFTLFKQSDISYPKTQDITLHSNTIQPLKESGSASCYVPNISEISATIPLNASAIIRCGQIAPKTPLLPSIFTLDDYTTNDYCSGIIFNNPALSNDTVHGIEMELPSFRYCMVDDMIYYNKGVIAYQSFDVAPYNKLYYLNHQHPEWQLLTKISWSALSPAILTGLQSQNKLFITTKAGQSVIYSFERNTYKRTSNMLLPYKNNNTDVHCIAYNQALNKIYRAINGSTYYLYSIHKNAWYDIPEMTMNLDMSRWHMDHQTLFVNPHCPYVLNTMLSASVNRNNKLLTAYFDQRDSAQKWTIV